MRSAAHGVYVWGADMPAALNRLEALEFLLACDGRAPPNGRTEMSRLTVYADDAPGAPLLRTEDAAAIADALTPDRRPLRALGQPGAAARRTRPPRRCSRPTARISTS